MRGACSTGPDALVQQRPQAGLEGEERRVVLEVGLARAGAGRSSRCPTMRPGRADSTATRSEMNTASAIEWVTNSTVVASGSHRRASRWRMSARVISSRAANGSSISSSGRAEGHRPDQGHALLHAARQLVRVRAGEVGQTDLGEQVERVGRLACRRRGG